MKTLTKTALVAISIVGLGAVSTAAYAADPVALPEGNTIYQASYSDEPMLLWTTQADGTATVIGTPNVATYDVTDGAWDPSTGKSYVIGNGYEGPCELWEADTTTGLFTYIVDITDTVSDEEATFDCDSFDIAPDGTAWVTLYSGDVLAQVNLADGTTSAHAEITGDNDRASWIAIQPSTGVVFLGDWEDDLYTIDPTSGATTLVEEFDQEFDLSWFDAAFDSNGRLWITGWPDGTELFSADVADFNGTVAQQGSIAIDGSDQETGTDSLWIERPAVSPVAPVEPALAATGLDIAGALGAGGALLLLGFGAFAVARTRRA